MNITEEWEINADNRVKAVWNPEKTKLISVEVIPQKKQDFAVAANIVYELQVDGSYLKFNKYGKQNVEFLFDGETQKLKGLRRLP